MEIKALKYSNRYGLSLELFEPGSLRMTIEEVCAILLCLKSDLNQNELDSNFSPQEQEVLLKYQQLSFDKMALLSEKYHLNRSVKKVHQELKEVLAWYFECVKADWIKLAKDFLGWKLVDPTVEGILNQKIRQELKNEKRDKAYFKMLLNYPEWGQVDPDLLQELEDRFGSFNLESI